MAELVGLRLSSRGGASAGGFGQYGRRSGVRAGRTAQKAHPFGIGLDDRDRLRAGYTRGVRAYHLREMIAMALLHPCVETLAWAKEDLEAGVKLRSKRESSYSPNPATLAAQEARLQRKLNALKRGKGGGSVVRHTGKPQNLITIALPAAPRGRPPKANGGSAARRAARS